MPWPLLRQTARLLFLKALCGVAEGAAATTPIPGCAAAAVAAAVHDPCRRLAAFGERAAMARSLASVYACFVTRFLGDGMRRACAQSIRLNRYTSTFAVARNDTSLFATGRDFSELAEFRLSEAVSGGGSRLPAKRAVSLQTGGVVTAHKRESQVFLASDGCIFVAAGNVYVFTPQLEVTACGKGMITYAEGVCADDDTVFVPHLGKIAVFARATGVLTNTFYACKRGKLGHPANLCFMAANRRLAVADRVKNRVSVFDVTGRFVRDIGVGVLGRPGGLACSAADELVVADPANHRVAIFLPCGNVGKSIVIHNGRQHKVDDRGPVAVALTDGAVYVLNRFTASVYVYPLT
jgi:DNA-binding beta-propeller fold protein YncE